MWGLNCDNKCGRCSGRYCSRINGSCTYGCEAGATGPNCEENCTRGFYGENCVDECGRCNVTNSSTFVCDPVSGRCPSGCESGWVGENCRDDILVKEGTIVHAEDLYNFRRDFLIAGFVITCIFFVSVIAFILWRWSQPKPDFFDKYDF
ncbi:hypothetical protein C0Q70_16812 [Pomacea canaliculata]|uniref:EGF-like domain-containing protein n=1 Tax=Pomacea canaliculata TaxID=400727 RepID=A0A2T7NQU0_POMCA|nr:hypothetical protein C0Q70_16812 [Pomacea canaliculata]